MRLIPEKGQDHFNVTQLTQLLTGSQCLPDQLSLNSNNSNKSAPLSIISWYKESDLILFPQHLLANHRRGQCTANDGMICSA